jgi:rhodanese-related sulfurtransferase
MKKRSYPFGKDMLGFCFLATASLCVALSINQLRNHPLSLTYATKSQRIDEAVANVTEAPTPTSITSTLDYTRVIGLKEFHQIVESKKGIILDARPEIFYRLGHVPGAISLPREDFENSYSKCKSILESNKDQTITVYCSGPSCEDSDLVAEALVKLAYHRVLVFSGGWDEWSGVSLPQEMHP